jgi:hypothetical protein
MKRVRRLRAGAWLSKVRARALRSLRRAPLAVQFLTVSAVAVAVWLTLNWAYQVVRKPSELFFPVSGTLYKTPEDTWRTYGALFQRHSTPIMTAPLLAALAQVEGSGNPVARTYWRWALTHRPFEIYRPASSAVGMYQMTNGTFAAARRYCIRDHAVTEDGAWYAWRSCWFNALYTRVVPSHAVELASAHLHRETARLLAQHRLNAATLKQKQDLAAVIHLCGSAGAGGYARRGLQTAGQRCGTHDLAAYLANVHSFQSAFARFAAAERRGD